jgi:AraC family transcriptional regulator
MRSSSTRIPDKHAGLHHLLADIGSQFASGWLLARLYADLLSLRLATALLASHTIEPVKLAPAKGGLCSRKLQLSLAHLTENVHRDVSLSEAATVVGLSSFHFARLFRKATGTTPYNYHMSQRMRRAKHLLSTTGESVECIADKVGFGDASSFSRAFKAREQEAPRQWRLRNRF